MPKKSIFSLGDLVVVDTDYYPYPEHNGIVLWKVLGEPLEKTGRFLPNQLAIIVGMKHGKRHEVEILTCKGERGWLYSSPGDWSLGKARLRIVDLG